MAQTVCWKAGWVVCRTGWKETGHPEGDNGDLNLGSGDRDERELV